MPRYLFWAVSSVIAEYYGCWRTEKQTNERARLVMLMWLIMTYHCAEWRYSVNRHRLSETANRLWTTDHTAPVVIDRGHIIIFITHYHHCSLTDTRAARRAIPFVPRQWRRRSAVPCAPGHVEYRRQTHDGRSLSAATSRVW